MTAKVIMPAPDFYLVAPLAGVGSTSPRATDMRTPETARPLGHLHGQQQDLFNDAGRSGAVSPLIDAHSLRRGDVDSANLLSTPATANTPGTRTSTTATRTTGTRTTSFRRSWSADKNPSTHGTRHADFSLANVTQAYLDCRRHKRSSASARAFEQQQEANLAALSESLQDGSYTPGRSICFVVTRPKPREVWCSPFADRIGHHVLYNHVAPRFHAGFIADSCACIPGRGTLYAARRLESKVRSITQNWSRPAFYLKCDLANFFVSIDKRILRERLASKITEPWLMELADTILFHDPRTNVQMQSHPQRMALVPAHKSLLNQSADFGLPIGNLSSQFFANVYLDALDQYVKHQLRARHYIRYVDDFLILDESPQRLNAILEDLTGWLPRTLGVRLNPAKTILQPIERGIDFVGQVIKPWRRTLRRRTLNVALARLAKISQEDIHTTANSYFGLMRQTTHSHHDRALVANVARRRGFTVDATLTKIYRRPT